MHYTDYVDKIEELIKNNDLAQAESLLLHCVDLTEAESEEEPAEETPVEEDMESVEEKFYDVFLKNGGAAHVINTVEGKMSEGDKMTIDGLEAAAGEYELSSGEVLTVGESGVIEAIANVDSEDVTEDVTEEVAEEVTDEEKEIQGVVNNLKNLVKQIKELKSQFEDVKENITNLEKENKELKDEVSKFAGAPSAESTKTRVDFSKADKAAKLEFFSKRNKK